MKKPLSSIFVLFQPKMNENQHYLVDVHPSIDYRTLHKSYHADIFLHLFNIFDHEEVLGHLLLLFKQNRRPRALDLINEKNHYLRFLYYFNPK